MLPRSFNQFFSRRNSSDNYKALDSSSEEDSFVVPPPLARQSNQQTVPDSCINQLVLNVASDLDILELDNNFHPEDTDATSTGDTLFVTALDQRIHGVNKTSAGDETLFQTVCAPNDTVIRKPIAELEIIDEEKTPVNTPQSARRKMESDEEISIPKGTYSFDFDSIDLNAVDPFGSGKGLKNSPVKKSGFSAFSNDPLPPPKQETKAEITDEKNDINHNKPAPASPPATTQSFTNCIEDDISKNNHTTTNDASELAAGEPAVPHSSYSFKLDDLDSIDPFKTSKGLMNSPVKETQNPFESKNALKISPTTDIQDPFKASNVIPNSPVKEKIEDPFKTKNSLKFSPTKDISDPFAPSKTLRNSPPPTGNIDPFKSRNSLQSSPPANYTDDQFKSRNASQDSPVKIVDDPTQSIASDPPTKDTADCEAVNDENDVVANTVQNNHTEDEKPRNVKKPTSQMKKPGLAKRRLKKPNKIPPVATNNDDDVIKVPSKGYSINFDDLENIDPFKTKSSIMMNSPTKTAPSKIIANDSPQTDQLNENPFQASCTLPTTPPPELKSADSLSNEDLLTNSDMTISDSNNLLTMDKKFSNPTSNGSSLDSGEGDQFYPARDVFESQDNFECLENRATCNLKKKTKKPRQSILREFDPLTSRNEMNSVSSPLVTKTESSVDPAMNGSAMDSYLMYSHTDKNCADAQKLQYTEKDLEKILEKEKEKFLSKMKEKENAKKAIEEEMKSYYDNMKGYEEIIAHISRNKKWDRTSEKMARVEHEAALDDLRSTVNAHADLARRYEKLKEVVRQHKENEEVLKKTAADALEKAKLAHEKQITAEREMSEQLLEAQNQLKSVKEQCSKDVSVAEAQLRMQELKCSSLERELQEQEHQAKELAKLCDELIARTQSAGPE